VTVVLRSNDVRVAKSECHGVPAGVTKVRMLQSGVRGSRTGRFVSNEGSEPTGKGLKVRELVVYDEYEAPC
jgi:hypothetical protein